MGKIFIYFITGISVSSMVYAFYKVVKDAYFTVREQKKLHRFTEHYEEMFSKDNDLNNNQKDLFDFEIIQSRSALLKKNTGKNLCTDCEKIEYIEYFPTIKY